MGPKSLLFSQCFWEGGGLRRYAICVAPHCLQYTFRDWARYHATRSSGRRCAHHLLAITSLPARKGVGISEGSAPDNDAAPSVASPHHFLKLCLLTSLADCPDSVLVCALATPPSTLCLILRKSLLQIGVQRTKTIHNTVFDPMDVRLIRIRMRSNASTLVDSASQTWRCSRTYGSTGAPTDQCMSWYLPSRYFKMSRQDFSHICGYMRQICSVCSGLAQTIEIAS